MQRTASIIITLALVIGIGIIVTSGSLFKNKGGTQSAQNVEIKDGVQYIRIEAKGGYSPKVSEAKAGIPTKLIVTTGGTFDCSASLVIKSLNYQKILPQTGETEIDIGTPKAGEPFQGVCGMGMYNFVVNFT